MAVVGAHVCCWGFNGNVVLTQSLTGFDPERKSRPKCADAYAAFGGLCRIPRTTQAVAVNARGPSPLPAR